MYHLAFSIQSLLNKYCIYDEAITNTSRSQWCFKADSAEKLSLDALKFPTLINIYKAFGDIKVQGKCV